MYRKLYNKLLIWKDSPKRKPLVLDGARQVGKSWLVEEFASKEYSNWVKLDLREENSPETMIFENNTRARDIIMAIAALTNERIEPGKTLIFIDEIQDRPKAIRSLKAFKEEAPEFHVIAAGSMLGLAIHKDRFRDDKSQNESFPVGQVNMMTLYPMDFGEFLIALGRTNAEELLAEGDIKAIDGLHEFYERYLRLYYYIGGMPEVVKAFAESIHNDVADFSEPRRIQMEILSGYDHDFTKKNSMNDIVKIRKVWSSLTYLTARQRQGERYKLSMLGKDARWRDYDYALSYLEQIGIVYRVNRVNRIETPLSNFEDTSRFKLYPLDCGLLGAMSSIPATKLVLPSESQDMFMFKGAFAETYILQQILASEYPSRIAGKNNIFYFADIKEDNQSSRETLNEIDFCLHLPDAIPLEVKAETGVQSKSLAKYLKENPNRQAIRASMKRFDDAGRTVSVPLYLIGYYLDQKILESKKDERLKQLGNLIQADAEKDF